MKTRIGIAILATFLLVPAGPASALNIYSADIVNGEVKTLDLDSNAVTTTKILNGEVKNADLGADAVTTDKVLNGTIGTNDLANDAVTDAKIANGTISNAKLATPSYSKAEVDALIAGLQGQIAQLQTLLQHFSVDGDDIYISGANVHIVNGLETTQQLNGLGNLTIGYNELRNGPDNNRTGSHNLIVGMNNNYIGVGGIVGGYYNEIGGMCSNVIGGVQNRAVGDYSSVTAGVNNNASGLNSSVTGGYQNTATGHQVVDLRQRTQPPGLQPPRRVRGEDLALPHSFIGAMRALVMVLVYGAASPLTTGHGLIGRALLTQRWLLQ